MDFLLDEKHKQLRNAFKDFAEAEVKPDAAKVDESEIFPADTIRKLKQKGWLGMPFEKDMGGPGLDTLATILCIEELSKACASTGVIVSSHIFLCCDPIFQFGTAEQKSKYLLPMAKGEKLGAFALTERNAGTDAAGQETTAVLSGDHYVLNGSKMFITNAGHADVYIVFAMTDKQQGTRGISAFIVEKGFPGFAVGELFSKMGIRGSTSGELFFRDCIVPRQNLLGQEGKGFKIALRTLDGGRIGIAAQALGIAEGAFEEALRYVRERRQFGRPISDFQNTQFELAEMKTKIDAAALLTYRAALTKETEAVYSVQAAEAKLFASRSAMDVTTRCLQLFGGYGYLKGNPLERMMRDAKITEIYEGTSEVQKMVLAGAVLK